MKSTSLMALSLVTASFVFGANSDSNSAVKQIVDEPLIACFWVTYCGDPDNYNPILSPKSDKTETQDTKDEKLA